MLMQTNLRLMCSVRKARTHLASNRLYPAMHDSILTCSLHHRTFASTIIPSIRHATSFVLSHNDSHHRWFEHTLPASPSPPSFFVNQPQNATRQKSALAFEDAAANDEPSPPVTVPSTSTTATATTRTPFLLTDIGEGIHDVEIIQWYVSPGDTVQQFDKVCEVQSDKATVDITSRYDGVIDSLCGDVGDMIEVGSPLLFVLQEEPGEEAEGAVAAEALVDETGSGEAGPSGINGVDTSDPQRVYGLLSEIPASEGKNAVSDETGTQKVLASPAVRRLGKEFNLNLSSIEGNGKDGRILKSDVLKELKLNERHGSKDTDNADSNITNEDAESVNPTLNPRTTAPPTMENLVIPIRGYNRIMVKAMETTLQVPHMVYSDEVEMSALKKCREELKPLAAKVGVKLSYLPFAIKACSLAMLEHPLLNSSIDTASMSITIHKNHDIAVAIDSPNGLVVPVIRNCQDLSVMEIAVELNRLRILAESCSLCEDDLTLPTFTLSNIGSIGGTVMSPVVLPPQVAIGAMGKIQRLPRFVGDSMTVEEAHLMNISWGGDHRVLDGGTLGKFSNRWKSYIEKPMSMVLNMK